MASRAHATFRATVARSIELVELYQALPEDPAPQLKHPDDLIRAAIVLAVSAMDSFFTLRFSEAVIPYIKKHGTNERLTAFLSECGLDTAEALGLLTMDRPYRRIRTLVQNRFERYTTQQFKVIDDLFLCFGIKNLSQHAEAHTGKRTLRKRVASLVARRHEIVHDGDLNKYGRLKGVNANDTIKRLKSLDQFISAVEDIIGSRLQ